VTKRTRSELMSRVRRSDTHPEVTLRKEFWAQGLRYRVGLKVLGVKPDIVFPGKKVAVFVDGCFWHGCPQHYSKPRSRVEYWDRKLRDNVARDQRQTRLLEEEGWRVLRFWEHQVPSEMADLVSQVQSALHDQEWRPAADWRVFEVQGRTGAGRSPLLHMSELRNANSITRMVWVEPGSDNV
jgi:DNA mismatch endonuclease (patch repair protein)